MIFLSLLTARESNTPQVNTYGPRLSTFLAEVVILFRQMMGMNDSFEKLMPLAGDLLIYPLCGTAIYDLYLSHDPEE